MMKMVAQLKNCHKRIALKFITKWHGSTSKPGIRHISFREKKMHCPTFTEAVRPFVLIEMSNEFPSRIAQM